MTLEQAAQIAFAVLTLCSLLCLYRIGRGPSAPDRSVAIDILGTLIVGFCCVMAIWTKREYYMNIAIAWALISFVGTLALAKYLEGRTYDA
jgi:multicomponent Na+:H+ antiporter subunit F